MDSDHTPDPVEALFTGLFRAADAREERRQRSASRHPFGSKRHYASLFGGHEAGDAAAGWRTVDPLLEFGVTPALDHAPGHPEARGPRRSGRRGGVAWELETDADGRITRKLETVGRVMSLFTYAYDRGGRLARVERDGVVVEEYAYDGQGRRVLARTEAGGMRPVRLEYQGDRLTRLGEVEFRYDADRLTGERHGLGGWRRYRYDARGTLVEAELPDGSTVEWERDALGLPLASYVDGTPAERWEWRDLLRLAAYEDQRGGLRVRFRYEGGQRLPHAAAIIHGGVEREVVLGYDQVGTLKCIEGHAGDMIQEIRYDSFGAPLEDGGARPLAPLGFAGGVRDRFTGFVRLGLRDYDPRTGRFTSPDPLGFTGLDPDRYEYALDDPIAWIDPCGLEPERPANTRSRSAFLPYEKDEGAPSLVYDPALQQIVFNDGRAAHRYEARNQVVPVDSKGNHHTPIEQGYTSKDVTPELRDKKKAWGPGTGNPDKNSDDQWTYIETHHPTGKDIHGGGSGCTDAFAPRQGWRKTYGCIRMQNEDIDALSRQIKAYKEHTGGGRVPYRVERR